MVRIINDNEVRGLEVNSLEDEMKGYAALVTSLKHYDTRIQNKPSHIYQKEDVRQLEGKLKPEGEIFSVL